MDESPNGRKLRARPDVTEWTPVDNALTRIRVSQPSMAKGARRIAAYTLYILDRNVRMATVFGLVGAGGIRQELKGRYDLYDYHHVGTILVAIFLLVLLLDQLASRLRAKLL